MQFRIGLAVIVATAGFIVAPAAQAACPSPAHDFKSITVSGRVSSLMAQARTFADGSQSTHVIQIKECRLLDILAKKPRGCKVGSTLTAKGKYFFCDEDSFDFGECDNDEMDAVSVTCR